MWFGDSISINCFAKYLKFEKTKAKTDFAKFFKVFIKLKNLNISRK